MKNYYKIEKTLFNTLLSQECSEQFLLDVIAQMAETAREWQTLAQEIVETCCYATHVCKIHSARQDQIDIYIGDPSFRSWETMQIDNYYVTPLQIVITQQGILASFKLIAN